MWIVAVFPSLNVVISTYELDFVIYLMIILNILVLTVLDLYLGP